MSAEGWLGVAGLAVQAAIFGAIFRKAGYSGWLGLLMAVPLANLVTLLWFATAHWPLEMGYAAWDANSRVDTAWELKLAVRKALALEKRGEYARAITQFELVAEKAGEEHPSAAMARERVRQLQGKGSPRRGRTGLGGGIRFRGWAAAGCAAQESVTFD